MIRQFTVLCLAVALSLIAAGTASATPPLESWEMGVTSVGSNTTILLTVDSNAVQQWKAETLYKTWGDPTGSDSGMWIPLANGGYLHSLTMGLFAEPLVSLDFVVTAGSQDTTFTITSAFLTFLPIDAEGTASASVTLTDKNQDGATLTGLYSGKVYEATYNSGTLFADLVPPEGGPIIITADQGTVTKYDSVPPWQVMGIVSDMQTSFKFTLSAHDEVKATSTFIVQRVVPEPSSIIVLLGGLGSLLAYRRRRA